MIGLGSAAMYDRMLKDSEETNKKIETAFTEFFNSKNAEPKKDDKEIELKEFNGKTTNEIINVERYRSTKRI